MAEGTRFKIKNYQTVFFGSCSPNQNQTRNCWQNYLDFHCCEKTMTAKGGDVSICSRHISWEDLNWLYPPLLCLPSFSRGGEGGPGYMVIPTLGS
ncbi:unnamed protein product [Nyctereutes procyonoides]|uniref:(raccoon dog) hypothetical protein n=1 Tax=Nyctereutes procyonoides TaxID=34880 RepID=A0A811YNS8_NYCPR|nr:unnamed protein product [Nyctereutes procyonoides]